LGNLRLLTHFSTVLKHIEVNLYCGYASSIAKQSWAPHTCIWQGFDKKYSIFKAYNLKGFLPIYEDVQNADI